VEKLRSLLPKDNEEAAGKVKHLYALLEPATLMDPVFLNEAKTEVKEPPSSVPSLSKYVKRCSQ
jgi:hypothetical protein